jgi:hypothetical protein
MRQAWSHPDMRNGSPERTERRAGDIFVGSADGPESRKR